MTAIAMDLKVKGYVPSQKTMAKEKGFSVYCSTETALGRKYSQTRSVPEKCHNCEDLSKKIAKLEENLTKLSIELNKEKEALNLERMKYANLADHLEQGNILHDNLEDMFSKFRNRTQNEITKLHKQRLAYVLQNDKNLRKLQDEFNIDEARLEEAINSCCKLYRENKEITDCMGAEIEILKGEKLKLKNELDLLKQLQNSRNDSPERHLPYSDEELGQNATFIGRKSILNRPSKMNDKCIISRGDSPNEPLPPSELSGMEQHEDKKPNMPVNTRRISMRAGIKKSRRKLLSDY